MAGDRVYVRDFSADAVGGVEDCGEVMGVDGRWGVFVSEGSVAVYIIL